MDILNGRKLLQVSHFHKETRKLTIGNETTYNMCFSWITDKISYDLLWDKRQDKGEISRFVKKEFWQSIILFCFRRTYWEKKFPYKRDAAIHCSLLSSVKWLLCSSKGSEYKYALQNGTSVSDLRILLH